MKEKCKNIHHYLSNHSILKYPYSLFVIAAGFAILLIGLIMLITPGPGVFFILLGTAILSTQFNWAKRFLSFALNKIKLLKSKITQWFKKKKAGSLKTLPASQL